MSYLLGFIVAAAIVAILIGAGRYLGLWLQALVSGTHIGLLTLMLMSLRGVKPEVIVRCRVMAAQAGLPAIPTDLIEAQFLAGGDVLKVTFAIIAADRAGIVLDWDTAAAIDLAGRDIVEAVQVSVNPKVINCPDPKDGRGDTLFAVAIDGIQLKARVLVTVRTNLKQLVGGATEETVTARVGQSIVTAIGSCKSYRDALGDPMVITREVIALGLDSDSAFDIISIDIADIDVGENIGAKLQLDQADADIRIARAFAEKRRAMAVAKFHEMKARTRTSQSNVILADAKLPLEVGQAPCGGRMSSISVADWDREMRRLDVTGSTSGVGY